MSSTTIQVFLPKFSISKNMIKQTLDKLLIGSIVSFDFHEKKTRKGTYKFAFAKIRLYQTSCAKSVSRDLKEKGKALIVYDEPHYFELKSFIPIEERCNDGFANICRDLLALPKPNPSYDVSPVLIKPTAFTFDDKKMMQEEFEDLEKEIYQKQIYL
jgi:hypothetical protein